MQHKCIVLEKSAVDFLAQLSKNVLKVSFCDSPFIVHCCISRSHGQKIGFKNAIKKIFLSEIKQPRAFIFGI